MTTSRGEGRRAAGLVLVALGVVLLCGLGVWQMQRLAWKTALLRDIAERSRAAPMDLPLALDAVAAGRPVEFARVLAWCPGLNRAAFVELYALREGQAGVRLISVCRVARAGYDGVLVDRGFIADTARERPAVDTSASRPVRVEGLLRLGERRGLFTPADRPGGLSFARDPQAIGARLGLKRPAPVFIAARTAINPELAAIDPAPLPAEIPNRHLEYALTWFGLAATLIVVALFGFRRRRTQ